jgi:Cu(I)/Ag(I) efflux system membrane fusion protein
MQKKTWVTALLGGAIGVILTVTATRYFSNKSTDINAATSSVAAVTTIANSSLADSLVQVAAVETQDISDLVTINGKISLNTLKVQQISSRIPGRVDRIVMVEGGNVKAGEPLAWIYSPEFISAQNEYLLARRTVRSLSNQATTDLLEDAKATLDGSRNKLRILGASNAEVSILDQKGIAQEYMAITSPINGKVTKRNVDPGGYLDMGSSLGSVADMSSLWFLGNVFEADLPKLREGQIAIIRVKGLNVNETYKGRISFISPIVDPDTHGVVVRVDLPNGNQQLKPDMFARAEIDVGIRKLPVVPRSAVVQDGAESFVVRKKTDGSFERISVSVTPANDPYLLAITSGLSANDQVVTEGGVLVDRALINEAKLKAMSNQSKIKSNEVKP